MLSVKPWKPDAVARLFLSVFVCIYAGSVGAAIARGPAGKGHLLFYAVAAAALGFLGAALVLAHQPWTLEAFLRRVGGFAACFYSGLILGLWSQHLGGPSGKEAPSVAQMIITLASFQGAAIVLVTLFLRQHGTTWEEAFGVGWDKGRAVLMGAGTVIVFLPAAWALQRCSADLLTRLTGTAPEQQLPVQTLRKATGWDERLLLGVATILVAPVAEELLFRGILYPAIKQAGFPRLALWGTSLLFGAMHLNLVTFLPLFVLALALAGLYEWTNNLLAPISTHLLFNAVNFSVLYLWDPRLTPP